MSIGIVSADKVAEAMMKGLLDAIRAQLRIKIIESLEEDITKAVDAAAEQFKIDFEAYMRPDSYKGAWELIIRREDKA